MIALRAGDAEAAILPEHGAAFTRLAWQGRDLLRPVPQGADPNRGFHGSFLMAPWTNRLDGGRIRANGIVHRMPINRPEEDTAIHGFLRDIAWEIADSTSKRLVLACRFDRPPFNGRAELIIRLAPDHLALSIMLTNGSNSPMPMGFGWHPYFPRPPGARFSAAARIAFGRDARNLPVAPRASAGLHGADGALEGLDGHFAGWDGTARIDWPDGHGVILRAAGAWASNLHVFAPRGGSALAVEPVSHAPDAPNRPAAAAHGAMHEVDPGGSLEGSLTIHWA